MTDTAVAEAPDATSPPRRPRSGAAGVPRLLTRFIVLAAVAVTVFGVIAAVRHTLGGTTAVPGLNSSQQSAVDAARQEAVNLQTYRRASFDKDFANALAGMTDQFKSQLQPKKADLQQALTTNKVDSIATVSSSALVSSTSSQAIVLVTLQTSRLADTGASSQVQFSRLQLTVKLVGGDWLVDNLTAVGLS